MSDPQTTSTPAWAWLLIGVLATALIVVVTSNNLEQPGPPESNNDSAELAAHLKEVSERLKSLEERSKLDRLERRNAAASQVDEIARVQARGQIRGNRPDIRDLDEADPSRIQKVVPKKADDGWVPPEQTDGHIYDDGVIVDMNPQFPAAENPIPASAQSSHDHSAEMRAAFPKGCPTCK